jgi:hypothetical protein
MPQMAFLVQLIETDARVRRHPLGGLADHLDVPDDSVLQFFRHQEVLFNGSPPVLHIGSFAYFRSDVLEFYWQDPPQETPVKRPIEVTGSEEIWRYYYSPVLELIRARLDRAGVEGGEQSVRIEELDVEIRMLTEVLSLLFDGAWNRARRVAEDITAKRPDAGFKPDGIRVIAGSSWLHRFEDEQ